MIFPGGLLVSLLRGMSVVICNYQFWAGRCQVELKQQEMMINCTLDMRESFANEWSS